LQILPARWRQLDPSLDSRLRLDTAISVLASVLRRGLR
jgi:hypothetical protein